VAKPGERARAAPQPRSLYSWTLSGHEDETSTGFGRSPRAIWVGELSRPLDYMTIAEVAIVRATICNSCNSCHRCHRFLGDRHEQEPRAIADLLTLDSAKKRRSALLAHRRRAIAVQNRSNRKPPIPTEPPTASESTALVT
jgi:hypothetical protein